MEAVQPQGWDPIKKVPVNEPEPPAPPGETREGFLRRSLRAWQPTEKALQNIVDETKVVEDKF